MARKQPSNAKESREYLANKYDKEATSTEDMAAMADKDKYALQFVPGALKNIAERKRTYAKTARRMNQKGK